MDNLNLGCLLFLLVSLFHLKANSQKTLTAVRIDSEIVIDGQLDEAEWKNETYKAKDFIAREPVPGQMPEHSSSVSLLYDDNALYVGAHLEDVSRDSIMTEMSERDDIGNCDFFGIYLDTYGNSNEAFEFIVTAADGQFDARLLPYNEDSNWDAVWESKVTLTDNGWYVEMRIPYSAFRFSKQEDYNWKVNMFRRRVANGERTEWVPVNIEIDNPFLINMGTINGIKNIKPPVRLSLSPYVSLYGAHSHDVSRSPVNTAGSSYNFGMDIKYGISDAFTLDMTLIPDFGQVQSDDQVLNLSPFEIQFSENRPFFTEGFNLFGKGDIFYSRRVGDEQQLYNASKISGRTKNGLGIGFFNAVGGEETVAVMDEENRVETDSLVAPLTNYNIIVFDQDLKNNGVVSLINTNVTRRGEEYHNANVTATEFTLKNKEQSFGVNGKAAYSQLINKGSENTTGHNIEVEIEKLKGKFTSSVYYEEISENYDHNDLGFLQYSNERSTGFYAGYRNYEGLWKYQKFETWLNVNSEWLYNPGNYVTTHFNGGMWGQLNNFWYMNIWTNYNVGRNNYFEPRIDGKFFDVPAFGNLGFWVSTDTRKKLSIELNGYRYQYTVDDWNGYNLGFEMRYRFTDRFSLFVDHNYTFNNNARGYVDDNGTDSFFGRRDQSIVSNVFGANYTINEKMNLNLRTRHYWSKVFYDEFFELADDGSLAPTDYNEFNDFSFSVFNVDLVYRWRFAPGSDIFVVWKNNISGSYADQLTNYEDLSYSRGVSRLREYPQNNSLSIRLIYYLDYHSGIKEWFD